MPIIDNPSFESGDVIWVGTGEIRNEAYSSYDGAWGCRPTTGSNPYVAAYKEQTISIDVNKITNITFWLITSDTIRVTIRYTDDSIYTVDYGSNSQTWTQYTILGSSLASGKRILKIRFERLADSSSTSGVDLWEMVHSATVPLEPSDPTLLASGIKELFVIATAPSDGGSDFTDIEIQISTSSTFASGNITWTKGSFPNTPEQANYFTSSDGVTDGTLYYARTRYKNVLGWGAYNTSPYNSITTWDVPDTSSDPTLLANAIGQIQVTKPTDPNDNGSTITDWYIEWDNDSGFPSPTGNSGDIAIGTLTYDVTGLGNGNLYYFHVRFKNAVGYGLYSAGTVNETTWDIPDQQDLILADETIEGSMIQIVRNSTYPNGNGEPVDSWSVWRSSSSGGTYTQLASGLTATTYDDWSVNGGETWYYKAKFINLVGDSLISINSVSTTVATPEIAILSDTWITLDPITILSDTWITLDPIAILSDTWIRIPFYKLSNTWITLGPITKLSDTTIMKIGEISRVSNTRISASDQEVTTISDSTIFREGFNDIQILSDIYVQHTFESTIVIDSRIKNTYEQTLLSDSTIFHPSFGGISLIANERIVAEGTIVLPPIYVDSRILISNEITKLSDSFIVIGQEITTLSDSAIYISGYNDITKISNSAIYVSSYGNQLLSSDSAIYKSGIEITILNDTRILRPGGYLYPFQQQLKNSDVRIKNVFQLNKVGTSRILSNNEFAKLSDTFIIYNLSITKISDTSIQIINSISAITRTKILNVQEASILSDSIIANIDQSFTKLSDTLIHRDPTIDTNSNSRIKISFEISHISDTHIINEGTEIIINSNSSIYNIGYGNIEKESQAVIKILNQEIIKLIDTRIKLVITKTLLSDTSIRRDRSNIRAVFQKGRQL